MSVLIYRRFGGSLRPRYLSFSLSLFCSLWRLSFPFALIRHFLPCSDGGKRLEVGRETKETGITAAAAGPVGRLDRSISTSEEEEAQRIRTVVQIWPMVWCAL